jgi:DNA adenine methylase
MSQMLTPPLKWFGGKHGRQGELARWIVSLMPPHRHYVETHAGGLVLLARDPNDPRLWAGTSSSCRGVSEVVNDIHGRLMNFWRVLRDPDLFGRFARLCQATPLGRPAWEEAHAHAYGKDPVADAYAFFVDCRQSRAGTFKGFTSLTRSRTRRGVNGNSSEWLSAVEGLPAVHARLWPVVLECMPALDLIPREDGPDTAFYCDPPYLHETRATTDAYAHEMSEADHRDLLGVLAAIKGKFMLSGHRSDLYDTYAARHGWRREEKVRPNDAAGGKSKGHKVECLWLNF